MRLVSAMRYGIVFVVLSLSTSYAIAAEPGVGTVPVRPEIYAPFTLSSDLSELTDNQRAMLGLFIEAAEIMDELFWQQAYGDRESLLSGLSDPRTRRFAEINYGPWDRLAGNAPFVAGVGAKPPGAGFYPTDMDKAEFERAELEDKRSEYTLLKRVAAGALSVVRYSEEWQP